MSEEDGRATRERGEAWQQVRYGFLRGGVRGLVPVILPSGRWAGQDTAMRASDRPDSCTDRNPTHSVLPVILVITLPDEHDTHFRV